MNQQLTPHRGVLILVLGILSFVVCPLCGVASWVMGNSDMEQMDAGSMDPEGRGLTQAGKICGMISLALTVLSILAFIAMMVLSIGFGAVAAN